MITYKLSIKKTGRKKFPSFRKSQNHLKKLVGLFFTRITQVTHMYPTHNWKLEIDTYYTQENILVKEIYLYYFYLGLPVIYGIVGKGVHTPPFLDQPPFSKILPLSRNPRCPHLL